MVTEQLSDRFPIILQMKPCIVMPIKTTRIETIRKQKAKLAILNRMVKDGNNVGKAYVEDRVHFFGRYDSC